MQLTNLRMKSENVKNRIRSVGSLHGLPYYRIFLLDTLPLLKDEHIISQQKSAL